ncbi:unnamed protein product [Nesidiocoris tenuis]|uniref:Sulfotransferase domain-containing protein n=1 Tax=Nesidiocoris tenuis TaxID=355587 RepID=A0A6H5H1R1_9HEMI|nr:unnamed protein product [Nesidiocoris tenuis]
MSLTFCLIVSLTSNLIMSSSICFIVSLASNLILSSSFCFMVTSSLMCFILFMIYVWFDMADSITAAEELPSPRLIKSHLPPDLLPSEIWTVKPKLLYVYRNPKDVAISYCHHYRLFNEYTGSQDLFIEAFLQDKVMFSPFWKHVLAYWNRRDLPQLKFITFDDMKKDLRSVLKSVAEHLNVTIPADREDEVLDHLSFARMSKNPMVNFEAERKEMGKLDQHFIRKGETGQWKKTLSEELVKRFDSWSNSFLAGSDFPYYS